MADEVEDVEQNYKDDFLTNLAEKLGAAAKASLVFGEAVERDGVTVIPVAKSRWGFGGGGQKKIRGRIGRRWRCSSYTYRLH